MTTQTQHTPGPWKVHNNIGRKGELGIVADKAPCIVAIMGNAEAWPVEAHANARLIAAAPELLAALEAILDTFNRNNVPTPRYLHRDEERIRAIIAKAKGENTT